MARDLIAERRVEFTAGDVLTCGFVWYEMWPLVHKRQRRKYVVAVVALVAGGLVAIFKPTVGLALAAAALAFGFWTYRFGPGAGDMVNGLRFRSDGRIETIDMTAPVKRGDGFARASWMRMVRSIDELLNLSMQPMKNTAGGHYRHGGGQGGGGYAAWHIVLDFSTGERLHAARLLPEDDARIILTQLQQGLEKVRARRLEEF